MMEHRIVYEEKPDRHYGKTYPYVSIRIDDKYTFGSYPFSPIMGAIAGKVHTKIVLCSDGKYHVRITKWNEEKNVLATTEIPYKPEHAGLIEACLWAIEEMEKLVKTGRV